MRTQLPSAKGTQPQIFGPYLLWSNGWVDQDATWYGGRPRPKRHCVRWGSSSTFPKKGKASQFSAHVYCSQTAGWIKIPLDMEVSLGPGHIVLDGKPAPPPKKRGHSPNFRPMSIVAKRLDRSRCHVVRRYVGLSACHVVLDGDQAPLERGTADPSF